MYCQRQAFRNICGGHCDIMVVHSKYMDSVFCITKVIYQSRIQSSAYYNRILWYHNPRVRLQILVCSGRGNTFGSIHLCICLSVCKQPMSQWT